MWWFVKHGILFIISASSIIGIYFTPEITTGVTPAFPVSQLTVSVALASTAAVSSLPSIASVVRGRLAKMKGQGVHLASPASQTEQEPSTSAQATEEYPIVPGELRVLERDELVNLIVRFLQLRDFGLTSFIDNCVILTIASTVESTQTLSDRTPGFTVEEIGVMQHHFLEDIADYDVPGGAIFLVRFRDGAFVEFSDRFSSTYETRGILLRNALDERRGINPHVTLYAALTEIVQDPIAIIAVYLTPLFFVNNKFFLETYGVDVARQNNARVLRALYNLVNACIRYGRVAIDNGVGAAQLRDNLQMAIQADSYHVITMAFNDAMTVDNILGYLVEKINGGGAPAS